MGRSSFIAAVNRLITRVDVISELCAHRTYYISTAASFRILKAELGNHRPSSASSRSYKHDDDDDTTIHQDVLVQ